MSKQQSGQRDFSNLITYEGKCNYEFELTTQSSDFYLASNLVATAKDYETGFAIPVKCRWFRIKDEKSYNLNAITGTVYQLSAEDVACKIRVEVEPMDDELYIGKAIAEFGPVGLEPSMRQMLEYILGSGGARFQVTIYYPDDRNRMISERKSRDGILDISDEHIELHD